MNPSDEKDDSAAVLAPLNCISEVHDVFQVCPKKNWDAEPRENQRAWGLIGRWAIERLLDETALTRGKERCQDRSLPALCKWADIELPSTQAAMLKHVDRLVTATELDPDGDWEVYGDACSLVEFFLGVCSVQMFTHRGKP